MYKVAASTLQSWPRTVRLSPVRSFENKTRQRNKDRKKSCKNINTPVAGNCITPCASGCGGAKSFNGREYMLVFKDGKRLSTKMETTLKNNYAFSVWW